MSQQVAFRRIHGHIVPIKLSKDENALTAKDIAKSGAQIVGGAGVAAASGQVAAALTHKSARLMNLGFKAEAQASKMWTALKPGAQLGFFKRDYAASAARKMAASEAFHVRSDLISKVAKRGKALGFIGSWALIASGANTLLNKTSLKHDDRARAAVSAGAGITAQFALDQLFQNRLGANLKGVKLGRKIMVNAARVIASKL